MNQVCSLVEITAFRLESKSCKGFFLQINFSPMSALEFIRDHVTFKLPYDFSYYMKTHLNTLTSKKEKVVWLPNENREVVLYDFIALFQFKIPD